MRIAIHFFVSLMLFGLLVMPVAAAEPCGNTGGAQPNVGTPGDPLGVIQRPCELDAIPAGAQGISFVLGRIIQIAYALAGVIVMFMLIIGAYQWITSGGNKESLGAAQKRIQHALIGLVILAVAAPLAYWVGKILGFNVFGI